ncbi:Na+/H+ antiporter subunit E [Paralimibaculum aggregatum]|uniref:Na+/H+ antiporter subunit E n=1 Tax=Paralimibaculum aggregatum TaxID=3036245 RepID=A0ABQ6LR56_9RHOB|nr:Na+/H+ antiporter subunit E [Limibaculum sp. NKW23]GMG84343.1 Na+/H+ antiporter subunit E [Limibaculum sp. NKW23]
MIRMVLIALVLFAFWLLLSGNYKLWLVASGAASAMFVVAFARAKQVTDGEGFPAEMLPRALLYWPWLIWQIVLSAINVARIILDPKLPISPTVVRVDAKQKSSVGLVTYANSITLTPGTISVEVGERVKRIWVHAITKENAAGFADDEMNARVAKMEGR